MKETLIKMIRKITTDWESEIVSGTDLYQDLYFDDLDSVELLIELETKFNITISDSEWEKCKTVQDVLDLIEKNV